MMVKYKLILGIINPNIRTIVEGGDYTEKHYKNGLAAGSLFMPLTRKNLNFSS